MEQQALDQLASLIQTDLEEDLIIYLTLSELNYVMSVIGPFDENTDKRIQFRIYKTDQTSLTHTTLNESNFGTVLDL